MLIGPLIIYMPEDKWSAKLDRCMASAAFAIQAALGYVKGNAKPYHPLLIQSPIQIAMLVIPIAG